MSTEVKISAAYGLVHRHPGLPYWHFASDTHVKEPTLHADHDASHPKWTGEGLTAEVKALYRKQLNGFIAEYVKDWKKANKNVKRQPATPAPVVITRAQVPADADRILAELEAF